MNRSTTDIIRGVRRQDRLAECWRAMEEILGEPLLRRCRKRRYANARALIHYRMHLDGYSGNGTANLVGVNHATALNARRQAEWMVAHPKVYTDEARWWEELNEKIMNV